jgi:hypothetical protein
MSKTAIGPKINIDIDFDSPVALVESNYDGQYPRQMPIYLKIFLSGETANIAAQTQNYDISGTPFSEWHGHDRVFGLPNNVDASALHDFVKIDIAPLVEKVAAGYTNEWDGNNYVAGFTDDSSNALDEIERALDDAPTFDEGGLWDLGEWLDATTCRPTIEDPSGKVDGHKITARTTDDELDNIKNLIESAATDDNVVLDGNLDEYLTEIRDDCRDLTDDEED